MVVSHPKDQTALRAAPGSGHPRSGPAEHALDAYCLEFDYLCRTLRRLGIRDSDIEDVAHQVFLVLYRKWEDYDPRRPLRPYLFGIAFRVAAAHRRQHRREVPWKGLDPQDPAPQPDQVLWSAEARAIVLRALEQVPFPRRAVFIMHELDETPMRAIADVLGIPVFTAYSRLRKARAEFTRAVKRIQGGKL